MKQILSTFFILFAFIISAKTILPTDETVIYEHLFEVNKQWLKHKNEAPTIVFTFENDTKRIATHLELVIEILGRKNVNKLSKDRREKRILLLEALSEYAKRGVFPTNSYHKKRTPYFIDDYGIHCAVGYLIKVSGNSDLALKIQSEHNYSYIKDITTDGLMKWAKEHGFTVDELAWIQPAYPAQETYSDLGDGTNDHVVKLCEDALNDRMIVSGNFTEADGISCSGIASYQNGQFTCLGGGLNGTIHDAFVHSNGDIIVSGLLNDSGTTYSQALFTNNTWNYVNIPNREGVEAITSDEGAVNCSREVVLKTASNLSEIWRLDDSGTWTKEATVSGIVNDLSLGTTEYAYGGQFSSITAHRATLGDTTFPAYNALIRSNSSEDWSALSGQISSSINVVKWIDGTFFFGGVFDPAMGGTLISIYTDDTLASLIEPLSFMGFGIGSVPTINDILDFGDNTIMVSGEFMAGFMAIGNCLATINYAGFSSGGMMGTYSNGIGGINGPIKSMNIHNNELFVGGTFTSALNSPVVNNIAKLDTALALSQPSISGNTSISIYPNPAKNVLHIDANTSYSDVQILDINGRLVIAHSSGQDMLDLSGFSDGTYILTCRLNNGQEIRKRLIIRH